MFSHKVHKDHKAYVFFVVFVADNHNILACGGNIQATSLQAFRKFP